MLVINEELSMCVYISVYIWYNKAHAVEKVLMYNEQNKRRYQNGICNKNESE